MYNTVSFRNRDNLLEIEIETSYLEIETIFLSIFIASLALLLWSALQILH